MSRWRVIGLGGCLTIVILVVAVLAVGGGDKSHAVPDGHPAGGKRGLMDALAASASGTAPPTASAPARTAGSTPSSDAAPGLPTSQARAAARMFLVGFGGPQVSDAMLRQFALHEWGGVVLEPGNGVSPQQVADVVGRIRGAAVDSGHEVPLMAASQLGGDLDAVPVGAPPQSRAGTAKRARANALAVAKALHPLGIRMVLAPDADIGFAGGPWEGVAFSDDPQAVIDQTAAAVAGFKDGDVAPAPGHFPGEGAASGDPALEAATVGLSLNDLKMRDLKPFAAVAGHVPAIQLSSATYVAWDGVTPATLLPGVVKLLRDDLGFHGVVVSGDLQAASLAGGESVARLAVDAIKAGCDLVWIPGDAADQDAAWRAVAKALRTGEIPVARVAEALKRVDALRAQYGVK